MAVKRTNHSVFAMEDSRTDSRVSVVKVHVLLLPVFALGRAQELLLILDELCETNPDIESLPI